MKHETFKNIRTLLFIALIYPLFSNAQTDSIWYIYYDDYKQLSGFKNSKGDIMIEPKFNGITGAKKFDKIMSVLDASDSATWVDYYLLKDGTKIITDSMYIFDFTFACESEGYIKFRDPKTELVGLFNQFGKPVIPAEYINVSDVKNGLFCVFKDAQRVHKDTNNHGGCNHNMWRGGTHALMDLNNTILIENFDPYLDINYYSLKISKSENTEFGRRNFLGKDGNYYSFIDNRILFDTFINALLQDHSKKTILNICYDSISFADQNSNTFTLYSKNEFVNEKYKLLHDRLDTFNIKKIEFDCSLGYSTEDNNVGHVSIDITDNCGEINNSKYPVYKLTFSTTSSDFSETLTFIYLNDQYVLIDAELLSP